MRSIQRTHPGEKPAALAFLALLFTLLFAPALAAEESRAVWIVSGEVGVGPIEEDLFLQLTPRLSFLTPAPLPFCEGENCESFFEAALQVPLRFRIVDREPVQGERLRREDWLEVSDYFRVIRRLEYGTSRDPFHIRAGELGATNLGNATIVNGYYNVITTDHYRLGLQGRLQRESFGTELFINNLVSPNLLGLRAEAHPEFLYQRDSAWRKFSVGLTGVSDLTAPTALVHDEDSLTSVGANRLPLVDTSQPTVILGADVRWHGLRTNRWSLTPYTDLNHHFGLGTGLHTGVFYNQNFAHILDLSAKLEYRLLTGRYLPDYIDPLYEITRYQYPSIDQPGLAGPKLRVARSADEALRHGGLGQIQARLLRSFVLSAAYADSTGPSSGSLRLRGAFELSDQVQFGLFYYKFAQESAEGFLAHLGTLFDPDGALVASEGRLAIWGPVYAHGQYGRQWLLRDDGRFENIHLYNVGLGAAAQF